MKEKERERLKQNKIDKGMGMNQEEIRAKNKQKRLKIAHHSPPPKTSLSIFYTILPVQFLNKKINILVNIHSCDSTFVSGCSSFSEFCKVIIKVFFVLLAHV